ncbi:hypothetical protein BDN71DRAFT_1459035 [Pleurotus eryngii]|uniref:Uncharacterized protein n=1 Tax=Pleurotus eryngii TaxID=5323 RepID=A0A9P5ZJC4_PLEER|nr:hypothetical protein BDN71DRAFT_1459035 [Pleurotus eryngii]
MSPRARLSRTAQLRMRPSAGVVPAISMMPRLLARHVQPAEMILVIASLLSAARLREDNCAISLKRRYRERPRLERKWMKRPLVSGYNARLSRVNGAVDCAWIGVKDRLVWVKDTTSPGRGLGIFGYGVGESNRFV